MERILVIGCAGAGKSTLAKRLAAATGLPLIHLDREFWGPGWVEPDRAVWRAKVAALIDGPRWIMDGNYSGTLPLRLAAADAVVFLDFPSWLCLLRVARRSLGWLGRTRDDMGRDCPEKIDWTFWTYVWTFNREHRPRALAALDGFSGSLIHLRRPREVEAFLRVLDDGPFRSFPFDPS